MHIVLPVMRAFENLQDFSWQIGDKAHPPDPGTSLHKLNTSAKLVGEQQIGEIHTGALSQRMVAPGARVKVQQFVLSITQITLVFDLHQPVVINGLQKTLRILRDDRQVYGLYKCAGTAKLCRMLAAAATGHTAPGSSFFEKRAIGKLLLPIARHQLLNHDFLISNQLQRLLKALYQFSTAISTPGFGLRGINKMLLDRRFDHQW